MVILMLLENPFPADIRVEKEAHSLVKAGFDVLLLCPAQDGQPLEDSFKGIKIYRFSGGYPDNFFVRKLVLGYQALTFHNIFWSRAIINLMRRRRVDALHVHDLFLAATGVAVKKKTGIPVVIDLHENYPELLRIRFKISQLSRKELLLIDPDRWTKHESKILQKVDHIIVVVDEAKERLISLSLSSKKITVISNAEAYEFWEDYEVDEKIIKRYKDPFIISYIGGFGPHRGLDCTVKAMRLISHKTPNVKLLLVGKGGWYGELLERIACENGVSDRVEFVPWVSTGKVRSYLEATNIGLIPHNSNPHTETTVPHKLFQYMLFGKPVVVSSCQTLKRIVEETAAGLVFKAGEPDDLAEKILSLHNSPELCRSLGQNGKAAAISGKYSWNYQDKLLVNLYKDLLF